MMTTPHEQLKELFADRKPMDVAIEISGFTGFRTSKIDDLSTEEAINLLAIHKPLPKDVEARNNALLEEILCKEWKSKILAVAEQEGIKESGDFQKFNNWMLQYSVCKKHLNAYNLEELKALLIQMQALKFNNARSSGKPMNEAWWRKGQKLKNLN
ncbi:TPA: hypothetical protein ACGZ9C_001729 [Elizabethkingia anophelis]